MVAGARVAGPGRRARAAKGSGGCVVKKVEERKSKKKRRTKPRCSGEPPAVTATKAAVAYCRAVLRRKRGKCF
jgi:hypothetical protein